jgi:hypothetical protein
MVRSLAIAATLLPMLFHSIFGCCWHHTHVGVAGQSGQVAEPQHNCQGHQHHEPALPSNPQDCESDTSRSDLPCCPADQRCDEERCTFIWSDTLRLEFPEMAVRAEVASLEKLNVLPASNRSVFMLMLIKNAPAQLPSPRALSEVWIV